MGLLTTACPGRTADGRACPQRFWRFLSRPAACPRCNAQTAASVCVGCKGPLGFGAKICGHCGTKAPPQVFDDVFWSIPDGYFARRITVTLRPSEDRRFVLPAGVAVLALIDGVPRDVNSAGVDYWTVLSARAMDSAFQADQLRAAIETRCGVRSPIVTIVLTRPGPHNMMLEWQDMPTRAGLAAHVQLHLEFTVTSVERLLRAFLPSQTEVVSVDEVEVRVANSLGAHVGSALQSFDVAGLSADGARKALLEQLRVPLTASLESVGLSLGCVTIARLGSKEIEEIQREHAGAELSARRVTTLRLRSQTELQNQQVLLEHVEALESIESRKQAVIMAVATRTATGDIHGLRERERVQKVIREMEHTLRLEQVVSDADVSDLISQRNDASQRAATVRAIGLRTMLRDHELIELQSRLHLQGIEADAGRRERLGDAETTAKEIAIAQDTQRRQAELALKLKADEQRIEDERRDSEARRRQDELDAEHRRKVDLSSRGQEFEVRLLEMQSKLTAEQLAMVRGIDPELARALFRDDQRGSTAEQLESMKKTVESMTQSRFDEFRAQVAKMEEGQLRKDEQLASLHASTMKSLVELVGSLRRDSSRTTINVAGSGKTRRDSE